jgi:hypothetical protein
MGCIIGELEVWSTDLNSYSTNIRYRILRDEFLGFCLASKLIEREI